MDPNANLKDQHDLMTEIAEYRDTPYHPAVANARKDLHDTRVALHEWLRRGGYAPQWDLYPTATLAYRRWADLAS